MLYLRIFFILPRYQNSLAKWRCSQHSALTYDLEETVIKEQYPWHRSLFRHSTRNWRYFLLSPSETLLTDEHNLSTNWATHKKGVSTKILHKNINISTSALLGPASRPFIVKKKSKATLQSKATLEFQLVTKLSKRPKSQEVSEYQCSVVTIFLGK